MTGGLDRQRSRVYAWEQAHVAPDGATLVLFAAAQGMVDAIWADMGLRYPPRVEPLPGRATVLLASATRLSIRLPEATPSWVLLHELAHAMAAAHDGQSDGHGPRFVGLYARLLERYMRLPGTTLLRSLREARIAVDADARPVFLD